MKKKIQPFVTAGNWRMASSMYVDTTKEEVAMIIDLSATTSPYTIPDSNRYWFVGDRSVSGALTIDGPASPVDGQEVLINNTGSSSDITFNPLTLTVSPGSFALVRYYSGAWISI